MAARCREARGRPTCARPARRENIAAPGANLRPRAATPQRGERDGRCADERDRDGTLLATRSETMWPHGLKATSGSSSQMAGSHSRRSSTNGPRVRQSGHGRRWSSGANLRRRKGTPFSISDIRLGRSPTGQPRREGALPRGARARARGRTPGRCRAAGRAPTRGASRRRTQAGSCEAGPGTAAGAR